MTSYSNTRGPDGAPIEIKTLDLNDLEATPGCRCATCCIIRERRAALSAAEQLAAGKVYRYGEWVAPGSVADIVWRIAHDGEKRFDGFPDPDEAGAQLARDEGRERP